MNTPSTRAEIDAYKIRLYLEFPEFLTWHHSVNGRIERAMFCVPGEWLPSIRELLEHLQTLNALGNIDIPQFRDFKEKRGYLSIDYDGGCALVDRLVNDLEQSINN